MADIKLEILAIIVVIVVFLLALAVIIYRKRVFNPKKPATVKRKAAFSLGGNFVEDLNVPIETKYDVTTNVLGSGSSAQVVIGVNRKTKRKYAIKVIDLSKHEVAWRYEREKNFLRDIDHTNVVRLYEVYSSPQALYFVMELCTGGHLGQVLRASPNGRLDEKVACEYILQLTRAIGHCHHHGICHRDVKLQNVLLESSNKEAQVKLVDFGNGARFRGNLPLTKVVGTTYTAAPEVFKECYDERCDVWSLGVVTYILLSGRRPFEKMEVPVTGKDGRPTNRKEESVVASIMMGRYNFDHEVWDEISNDAINFIRHCFVLDYTKRNSAAAMLEHPWLVDDDVYLPSDKIRNLSFNSSDTLRRTMGRELSSPFSGIQHISMLAVAFARPTEKVQMLRKVFQEIDYNGSGMIERDEFLTAMKLLNADLTPTQTNELFQRIDQDGNHCISFIEFLAATLDPKDVDANELNQAFRLIDRDDKGYISREDVHRILCTTNVQDLEYVHDPTRTTAGGHSGSYTSNGASSSGGNAMYHTATAGLSAFPSGLLSSRRTSVAEGSGRSTQGAQEDVSDTRNRKLEQRIDEIMEQGDLNKDGVISLDEFMYAVGGNPEGGRAEQEKILSAAPAIVQKAIDKEESFVASLKRKISEGNVLFNHGEFMHGRSFPASKRKPSNELRRPWLSFRLPFMGSFYSKPSAVAVAAEPTPAAAPSSPDKDSIASGSVVATGAKDISIVSKFEEYERQHSVSMHSMPSFHSLHSHNNSREQHSRDYGHAKDSARGSDLEAPAIRRLVSTSPHHSYLSQSSKGPSWIEKPTPNVSLRMSGMVGGPAGAGLIMPSFGWSGRKSYHRYEELDIKAVIAKLEHTGEPAEINLRMNHDDPGLLEEREHVHRTSLALTHLEEGQSTCSAGWGDKGGANSAGAMSTGGHHSALELVDHEEDLELGEGKR